MKLVSIRYNANRLGLPSVTSILLGVVCLAGVLWLLVAPIFLATRCGFLLPHDHLLLGGASESDLAAHLAAEAACAAGGRPYSPAHIHIGAGTIISIPYFEPRSSASVLVMPQLVLMIPALLVGGGSLLLFVWSLPSPWVDRTLYFLLPGHPPPKASMLAV